MIFNCDLMNISSRTFTKEGFLHVEGNRIARPGIHIYPAMKFQPVAFNDRDPWAPVKVYRPPSEVFADEALRSFSGKVVTNNHPPEQLVTKANVKKVQAGHINGDVKEDGGFVVCDIIITDAKAIEDVKSGKVELSCGYESGYKFECGVTDEGEEYEAVQVGIRGNHLALVERGRAGASCRVADSDDDNFNQSTKEVQTVKVMIGGVGFNIDNESAAEAIGILQSERDKLQTTVDAQNKALEELKTQHQANLDQAIEDHTAKLAERDQKIEDLEKQIPTADQLDELASHRQVVIDQAQGLVKDLDCKGKSLDEIKKEVVGACTSVNVDEAELAYISARFDGLVDKKSKEKTKTTLDKEFQNAMNVDGSDGDIVAAAKAKREERNRQAWKGGEA